MRAEGRLGREFSELEEGGRVGEAVGGGRGGARGGRGLRPAAWNRARRVGSGGGGRLDRRRILVHELGRVGRLGLGGGGRLGLLPLFVVFIRGRLEALGALDGRIAEPNLGIDGLDTGAIGGKLVGTLLQTHHTVRNTLAGPHAGLKALRLAGQNLLDEELLGDDRKDNSRYDDDGHHELERLDEGGGNHADGKGQEKTGDTQRTRDEENVDYEHYYRQHIGKAR